jgi:hypothetical protein
VKRVTLKDYEVKRLAADIKAEPALIPRIADVITYAEAVQLSHKLSKLNRWILIQRYKTGNSKQPGWLVYIRYHRGRAEVKFVQGAETEAEARLRAVKPKVDKRYNPQIIACQRVGEWPQPTGEPP